VLRRLRFAILRPRRIEPGGRRRGRDREVGRPERDGVARRRRLEASFEVRGQEDSDLLLSGALYPRSDQPAALTVVTHLAPLSYGVDGLRGAFISRSRFGAVTDLAVLAGLAALLMLGARAFSRIEV